MSDTKEEAEIKINKMLEEEKCWLCGYKNCCNNLDLGTTITVKRNEWSNKSSSL